MIALAIKLFNPLSHSIKNIFINALKPMTGLMKRGAIKKTSLRQPRKRKFYFTSSDFDIAHSYAKGLSASQIAIVKNINVWTIYRRINKIKNISLCNTPDELKNYLKNWLSL